MVKLFDKDFSPDAQFIGCQMKFTINHVLIGDMGGGTQSKINYASEKCVLALTNLQNYMH